MKQLYLFLFSTAIISCSSHLKDRQTFSEKPLIIDGGEEEGWGADIRLSITEKKEDKTSVAYTAISTYQGKHIGLEVIIPKNALENNQGHAELMTIKSKGEVSDNLLTTLSELYKQQVHGTKKFVNKATADFIDLNAFANKVFGQNAGNKTSAKEFKIFFSKKQDQGELYLNINDDENWMEIREKDESYRPLIIDFLTAP